MPKITTSMRTYIILAVIFILSFLSFYAFPSGEVFRTIAGIPLVGSLIAALFQILRDIAAHERALTMFAAESAFTVGAGSHMANVAFDKHVQFSEEYAKEVHETLVTLSREGPTEKALNHAHSLYKIRQKHAVWLNEKLEEDLELFESALRKLGAAEHFLTASPAAADRQQWVNTAYKIFADVMGEEFMGSDKWEGEDLTKEIAISRVIGRLRRILGTEELAEMRSVILSRTFGELQNNH